MSKGRAHLFARQANFSSNYHALRITPIEQVRHRSSANLFSVPLEGIGAIVSVTAASVQDPDRAQIRVQNGGVHERGQNDPQPHVGLAKNSKIDKITVQRSGRVVQELLGVNANQVLQIKESAK